MPSGAGAAGCCLLRASASQCASALCAAVSARVFSLHIRIGICGNSEGRCGVSLHVQYRKFCHEAPVLPLVPTRFIITPCRSSKANVLLLARGCGLRTAAGAWLLVSYHSQPKAAASLHLHCTCTPCLASWHLAWAGGRPTVESECSKDSFVWSRSKPFTQHP